MVKKAIALMKKEIGGLHEVAYLLAFFTFLSQILAIFRDRVFAGNFGAGPLLDVYYASFKIPDAVFVSFASLVSASIIIPFIIEKGKEDKVALDRFLSSIFSVFLFLLFFSSVVVFFFTPKILNFLFPVFAVNGNLNLAVLFTRIMLLQPILLGMSGFISGILQSRGRFFAFALSPILYNLGIIIGAVFLYPIFGSYGLAFGVVLGALLHFLIQIPALLGTGIYPKVILKVDWKDVISVFRLSLPRTIALSANNFSSIILISFASSLGLGAVAVFNFGWNLQSVPLAIVGASYSMAAFPVLAKLFSENNQQKFLELLQSSVNHIIFWSMPFLTLFVVLRAQIVRVILGFGEFDWEDTRLTAATLAIFSVSIVAQGVIVILTRSYYARGKTYLPLFANISGAILVPLFSFFFLKIFNFYPIFKYFFGSLLRISDLNNIDVVVLPLGYTLGTILNALFLWVMFRFEIKKWDIGVVSNLVHAFCASVLGGATTYFFLNVLDDLFNINKTFGIFSQGFISGILGIFVVFIFLKLLKSKILLETESSFKKFLKNRSKPYSADLADGQNI